MLIYVSWNTMYRKNNHIALEKNHGTWIMIIYINTATNINVLIVSVFLVVIFRSFQIRGDFGGVKEDTSGYWKEPMSVRLKTSF